MPEATDEELGIPEGLDPNIRAELRKSRELQRENDSLRTANAAAEREAAFAKAGVPDTPLAAQLAKTYDGENDPASVKAFFEGLGVDFAQPAQQQTSDDELASQRDVARVGSQGEAGGDIRFEDALNSAKNPDELMTLIASAPEGATTNVGGRDRRIGVPTIE